MGGSLDARVEEIVSSKIAPNAHRDRDHAQHRKEKGRSAEQHAGNMAHCEDITRPRKKPPVMAASHFNVDFFTLPYAAFAGAGSIR